MAPRPTFPHLAPLSRIGPASLPEPGPRGRLVVAADGRQIGALDDLIVDIDADRVRYLVCRLHAGPTRDEDAPSRVLLPVRHTRLTSDGRIRLERCTSREVDELPRFRGSLEEGPGGIWTTYGTE